MKMEQKPGFSCVEPSPKRWGGSGHQLFHLIDGLRSFLDLAKVDSNTSQQAVHPSQGLISQRQPCEGFWVNLFSVKSNLRKGPRFLVFAPLAMALALLIMTGVRVVAAQTPAPSDDAVNAVARELYCPVCENVPLDVCPTTACAQWRELIRLKLSQGQSKEQIKQYFVAQYGDRVLAEPPRTGLNWLAYGLPPVIFLLGVFLVYRGLRGVRAFQSRKPEPAAVTPAQPPAEPLPSAIPPADPYLARVEDELRKRE
jgi:cytochrome c-type biogenesis protein CcmH